MSTACLWGDLVLNNVIVKVSLATKSALCKGSIGHSFLIPSYSYMALRSDFMAVSLNSPVKNMPLRDVTLDKAT